MYIYIHECIGMSVLPAAPWLHGELYHYVYKCICVCVCVFACVYVCIYTSSSSWRRCLLRHGFIVSRVVHVFICIKYISIHICVDVFIYICICDAAAP